MFAGAADNWHDDRHQGRLPALDGIAVEQWNEVGAGPSPGPGLKTRGRGSTAKTRGRSAATGHDEQPGQDEGRARVRLGGRPQEAGPAPSALPAAGAGVGYN